jgi:hypothetical protein
MATIGRRRHKKEEEKEDPAEALRKWLRSATLERRADLALQDAEQAMDTSVPWAATPHASDLQDAILLGEPIAKLQSMVDLHGGQWLRRSCNARGMDAVLCAAATGHLPTMRWLVETKKLRLANDVRDNEGATPLHHAALGGHIEMMRYLIEGSSGGAAAAAAAAAAATAAGTVREPLDVLALNNEEESVLHYAAKAGQLEAVQWLYERYRRRGKGSTAGLDLHDVDAYGSGLLHFASGGGSHELVEWLQEQGLSAEKKEKRGKGHGGGGDDDGKKKKKKKKPKDLKAIFRTLGAKWESEDEEEDDVI